ncbi:hypothetical protein [Cupriavidus sp. 2SB]|uniref:hypothetical protein n=1 Tax=Cupriavidus sp. 2SB TaxID=2502199 RepID=UPI0010F493B2|nr:hypothetical protein [Cupriavidus sp. 2SB]
MYEHQNIEVIRLRAAASANMQDAAMWRWYSDMMEDNRISCLRKDGLWSAWVDGRLLSTNRSYDVALRTACVLHRALNAV